MGDHNVCPSCGGYSLDPALPGCATPDISHARQPVVVDLLGAAEPDPGFPVHTITVTRIEYEEPSPSDVFGMDPIECEYEIDHGTCDLRGEECIVEGIVSDIGLHQSVFGVWDKDHRLEEKSYRVRGWTSKFDVPGEPVEYDAGIEEVEEVDDDE